MMNFSSLIRNLKKKLFGEVHSKTDTKPRVSQEVTNVTSTVQPRSAQQTTQQRDPYFIQIGFDFGTSYSKCVCRDIMTNKAWVHLPDNYEEQELPFLIPSTILLKDGKIRNVGNLGNHYPENGLYHLKPALVKTALRQWDDPTLAPYRNGVGSSEPNRLSEFVDNCAVYFLAGALGDVRAKVRKRLPDFGALPQDYMSVNLAVPVADAERPEVISLFQQVLFEAWGLADKLKSHPSLNLTELAVLRNENKTQLSNSIMEACFIYPEVSANVQGFVRSRVSSPGIYLFSDTGAETVDQSVFIFLRRPDKTEHLVYLHGRVFPLGSSYIERRSASISGSLDRSSLEKWRKKKEQGDTDRELMYAREWIAEGLFSASQGTLAFAKQKLYDRDQLSNIKVIFGGGGHCEHPYKTAVMHPFSGTFSGQLFRQAITPDIVGLPIPQDLELNGSETRWMRRLSVAYGLSFEKSELANFTYPKDVATPTPDQIWPRRKNIPDATSKDEC